MIIAIIQSRLSSSRLPGKVLLPLPYNSSSTALDQLISRLKLSRKLDKVVIATTTDPSDNTLLTFAESKGYPVYRGSLNDVLSRYYQVIELFPETQHVVRITSDCPCLSGKWVDQVIEKHLKEGNDYTSNSQDIQSALGFSVEILTRKTLELIHEKAHEPFEREHVTPYIYLSHPEQFKIGLLSMIQEKGPFIRATLDTQNDYDFLCSVFDELKDIPLFSYNNIRDLVNKKPWLLSLNKEILQKRAKSTFAEEWQDAQTLLHQQNLTQVLSFLSSLKVDNL